MNFTAEQVFNINALANRIFTGIISVHVQRFTYLKLLPRVLRLLLNITNMIEAFMNTLGSIMAGSREGKEHRTRHAFYMLTPSPTTDVLNLALYA